MRGTRRRNEGPRARSCPFYTTSVVKVSRAVGREPAPAHQMDPWLAARPAADSVEPALGQEAQEPVRGAVSSAYLQTDQRGAQLAPALWARAPAYRRMDLLPREAAGQAL